MKSKIVPCVDCSREFPRKELNRKFRCHDCALKIVGETVYQLSSHGGSQYEKWKQALKAAAGKL